MLPVSRVRGHRHLASRSYCCCSHPSYMHIQVAELGTVLLLVKGMTCASCVGALEARLRGLAGVTGVQVNLMSGQAKVEHDPKVGAQRPWFRSCCCP